MSESPPAEIGSGGEECATVAGWQSECYVTVCMAGDGFGEEVG